MALKPFVRVESASLQRRGMLGYWLLNEGDTAEPLECLRFSDKSIHMFGTWGGATVAMVGGNDPAKSQFDDLYDTGGAKITQSAARGAWVVLPNLYVIKPTITGGVGAAITVAVASHGNF